MAASPAMVSRRQFGPTTQASRRLRIKILNKSSYKDVFAGKGSIDAGFLETLEKARFLDLIRRQNQIWE